MAKASFRDTVLGKLTWGRNGWGFTFPLGRDRHGEGTIIASSPEPRPTAECLADVRSYVRWFRRNDGGMFWGHGIELSTDFAGKITGEPEMFG